MPTSRPPAYLLAVPLVLVLVATLNWLATDNPPEPDDRQAVRAQLERVGGIAMWLPVKLPPGYDVGRHWEYRTDGTARGADPDAVDPYPGDGTELAAAREVTFFPAHDESGDGLPTVVLCVQRVEGDPGLCWASRVPGEVRRRLDGALAVLCSASAGMHDLSAWNDLTFTDDLDEVRWLH